MMALLAGFVAACAAPARAADLAALKQGYADQQYGMFLSFNMGTFTNQEWASPGQDVNTFNPTSINTDQWAATARAAGMRYGVLVAKHVDGFALWNTSQSTYGVAGTAWYSDTTDSRYHLDIVKSYADSFRKAGLGVGLYYSIWDQQAGIGPAVKGSASRPQLSSAAAVAYIKSQLHDLLTDYGPITVIWLDGWAAGGSFGCKFDLATGACTSPSGVVVPTIPYATIRDYIRSVSPNTVIINDSSKPGGVVNPNLTDVWPYETARIMPPAGNTHPSEISDCILSDGRRRWHWFWNTGGSSLIQRTGATVGAIRALANARNAAYLLDVPPDRTGVIPSYEVAALTAIKTYYDGLRPGNLVIGKGTTQSSSSTSGTTRCSAGMAADGDRTNFARTAAGDYHPWWKIDLGKATAIGEVDIYSNPSYAGRLRDITVQVLAADGTTVVFTSALLNPGNTLGGGAKDYAKGPKSLVLIINGGARVVGQFIRITRTPESGYDTDRTGNKYLLDAAEVEAFTRAVELLR